MTDLQFVSIGPDYLSAEADQILPIIRMQFINVVEQRRSEVNAILWLHDRWIVPEQTPRQCANVEVYLNSRHEVLKYEVLEGHVLRDGKAPLNSAARSLVDLS